MRNRKLLSAILAMLCIASMLLSSCGQILPDNGDPDDNGGIVLPDGDTTEDNTDNKDDESGNIGDGNGSDTEGGGESDDNGGSDEGGSDDNGDDDNGTTDDDNSGNEGTDENVKIELPDDYVITMSDMERFLLTKDEQYPITNEYVELYQQESGGYIANAIKAGLVVDKTQHLPSQKWHYFDSWLYATIEEGMSWDASASDRSYGKFSCPELLLWIIEATGVDSAKVREAKDIAVAG